MNINRYTLKGTFTCNMLLLLYVLLLPWANEANTISLGDTISSQLQSIESMNAQVSSKIFVPLSPVYNGLHLRRCYFQKQLQTVLQSWPRYDYNLYYGGHVPTFNCREKDTVEQSSSWDGIQQHNSNLIPVTSVNPNSVTKLRAEHMNFIQ